jgi:hypothetical protein
MTAAAVVEANDEVQLAAESVHNTSSPPRAR